MAQVEGTVKAPLQAHKQQGKEHSLREHSGSKQEWGAQIGPAQRQPSRGKRHRPQRQLWGGERASCWGKQLRKAGWAWLLGEVGMGWVGIGGGELEGGGGGGR